MHPAPTPLPLLRVVTYAMALLALIFAAHLSWQRLPSHLNIENRYSDVRLQDRLLSGLLWLGAAIQPGQTGEKVTGCPPKVIEQFDLKPAQWQCARAALNAVLAGADSAHHVPDELPDEATQEAVYKTMQWLSRYAP